VRSVVLQSQATYLIVNSYNNATCDECRKGRFEDSPRYYPSNLHCPPWNLPKPLYRFDSHRTFPIEVDDMEIHRVEDLRPVVSSWAKTPCKEEDDGARDALR
jgi:hypothetical protein